MPSGFISTSSWSMGAIRTSAASLQKGVVERPWKERDQSTGSPLESWEGALGVGVEGRGAADVIVRGGSSERPFFRERIFDWDVMSDRGAGFVGVEATRTGTAVLVVVEVDVDDDTGVEVEEVLEVDVRLVEVGVVAVRVVGLARFTAAAFEVVVFV